MNRLIERGVDAVFCASDVMALGALRALLDAGLRVPDDVARRQFLTICLSRRRPIRR